MLDLDLDLDVVVYRFPVDDSVAWFSDFDTLISIKKSMPPKVFIAVPVPAY